MLWTLHHQQSEFIQPQTADDYKCVSDETPVKTLCFQIGIYQSITLICTGPNCVNILEILRVSYNGGMPP